MIPVFLMLVVGAILNQALLVMVVVTPTLLATLVS